MREDLTVVSQDGEALRFHLAELNGEEPTDANWLVVATWQGRSAGEGFRSTPEAVESWQDDLLDHRKEEGQVEICLGRWHELDALEVERLLDWLGFLLDGCTRERPPARRRLSAIAERELCARATLTACP